MKIFNNTFLWVVFFLFSFVNVTFSQEHTFFSKSFLWFKGNDTIPSSTSKLAPTSGKELNNYFNFNPVIDFSKNDILKKYNNYITKKASFFVVFKSSSSEDTNLIQIERGSFKMNLSTKKLLSDKEIVFTKGDTKTGAILSYLYNKNSLKGKKDGSLAFDDLLYNDKEFKNQLVELIYIPKILVEKEKNIVESYLALKYGISLNEGQNYYNSKRDTIWDIKKNIGFNNRITGIAKDDYLGLNQKQSGNSLKDGLTIGINTIEKTNIENKAALLNLTSLIWGDNGEETLLVKESNSIEKRMKRIWKIQSITSKPNLFHTQIKIDKKLMVLENQQNNDDKDMMWLAIDSTQSSKFNYVQASYYKATLNDENQLIFDNVKFNANTNYLFSIVKAPEFFVTKDIEKPNCLIGQNGKLNIGMVGGTAPYKIHIISNNYNNELLCNTEQMNIENLEIGSYSLEVIDNNKKTQKSNFVIDAFNENEISLTPNWYLTDDTTVKIIPKVTDDVTDFTWLFEGNVISTDKQLDAKNPGSYILKVSNKLGCKKEFPFKVMGKEKQLNDGYTIFPNPLVANDTFSIQFNLKVASNVSVQITDMNGKIIKSKEIGTIDKYQFNESLTVSGTYLILVSINGVVEANKLIVK